MNNSNEVNWPEATWKEINDAVVAEVFKVRTAQKVFPTMVLENNPTEIANDVINFTDLSIREGQTKQFVEIFREFPLTSAQVSKEPQLKTCKICAHGRQRAGTRGRHGDFSRPKRSASGQRPGGSDSISG